MPTEAPNASRRSDDGPGHLLALITSGQARTRNELAEVTGLSRSTVGLRLEALFGAGLIEETDQVVASKGRPSRALRLNASAGVIVSIDVGEERTRLAVTDLDTTILADRVERLELSDGPEALLDRVVELVRSMIADAGLDRARIVGLGLGLPAPVDYEAGRVMGWSVMAGWEGYDIRSHLRETWAVPILIDNDVNLLTLAEHRRFWPDQRHFFYVKAGNGIGSGMIIDGSVHRGAQGAAGDIGHTHISGFGDPQCRCGNLGCLESLAGGWALATELSAVSATAVKDARDVAAMVHRDDREAVARLRAAGRVLGEAVAHSTSLINPSVIALGGILGVAGDHLLAGVREIVYQRALPLATRQLRLTPTKFPSRAGIAGGAYLVRDHVLDPVAIDALVAGGLADYSGLVSTR